tara:strand:+ start:327 stop:488 length:162 start_codon:yes stop_codon:yes gene_type:complete
MFTQIIPEYQKLTFLKLILRGLKEIPSVYSQGEQKNQIKKFNEQRRKTIYVRI